MVVGATLLRPPRVVAVVKPANRSFWVRFMALVHAIPVLLWKAFLGIPSAKWEHVFVISCIAVSLDPLFFYIPIIDETNKCLSMDKTLRTIALILRSLTDIPLVIHIRDQICGQVESDYPNWSDSDSDSDSDTYPDSNSEATWSPLLRVKKKTAESMQWLSFSIIINFLAVLPVPQVAILVGFFRMRGSLGSQVFLQMTTINFSLVLQYILRVCQIYLSSKKFRMSGKWIKSSLNLFLYILAGHVFAAFWYFFAIERAITCWHQACRNTSKCVATFDCSSPDNTSINTAVLNELCPISSPNTTVFDFGIYLPVLKSGNTGSVKFLTKLFYSLWWGLKNLSNFGTNLETSSYMWENCFAILICVCGLLLFLYLIGNMQKYMELETTKSLKTEESRRRKIKAKKKEIKEWMSRNGVPANIENRIKNYIKQPSVVEKNIDAAVDVTYFLDGNRFRNSRIREHLKEYLVQNAVKKVPMVEKIDASFLSRLCGYMKPVIYEKGFVIGEAGEEFVEMIFIIQGQIKSNKHLRKGTYFGRKIQKWAERNYTRSYFDPLPTYTGPVKCQTKVEALALRALDLVHFIKAMIDSKQLRKLAGTDDNTDQNQMTSTEKRNTYGQPNQDDQLPVEPNKQLDHNWVNLSCSVVWYAETNQAATGCICRDAQGVFLGAESSSGGSFIDKFLAEASNIKTSIAFCRKITKSQGDVQIVVESENKDLIECLSQPLESNKRISDVLRPVLETIVKSASKFKASTFKYCERQSNAAANCIAKHAVSSDPNSSTWIGAKNAPDWLLSILDQDCSHLQEKPPSTEQNQERRVDLEPPEIV